jgi:uncharacterized iron-regulated membrane protein
MRRWIFRLHLWCGALAGAFFVVLGLSGCLLAFEAPLDRLLHARFSYVAASPQVLSLSTIIRSVKMSYPSDNIVAITFASSPKLSWEVALPSGIVYVNPHTGEILGQRQRGQTIIGFAGEVHVRLATGKIGATIIRWSNLMALLLLISGIGLWWPGRRIRFGSLRGNRRSWSDLHQAIGAVFFPLLIVAAGTGALISFDGPIREAIQSRQGPKPPPHLAMLAPPPQGSTAIGPDEALTIATAALPHDTRARIQMPAYGGTYRVLMVEHRFPEADSERIVTIDPQSGQILSVSSDNLPLIDRFFEFNEAVHTGSILGIAGRALAALAGIMVLPQAISGFFMWWKRTRKRKKSERIRFMTGVSK